MDLPANFITLWWFAVVDIHVEAEGVDVPAVRLAQLGLTSLRAERESVILGLKVNLRQALFRP